MDQLKLVGILIGLRPNSGSMGVLFKTWTELWKFVLLVGFLVLIGFVHLLTFQGLTMAGALNSLTFISVRHNAQVVTCEKHMSRLHFWFSLLTWPDCI